MGLIGNIKQMMQMRAETKRIQDRVNSIEETYENAGVGVRIRGDMTVMSISISPDACEELKNGKTSRFETLLVNTFNGAISRGKKTMQEEMRKMMMESGQMG